jgi:hypothetical protein
MLYVHARTYVRAREKAHVCRDFPPWFAGRPVLEPRAARPARSVSGLNTRVALSVRCSKRGGVGDQP